MIHFEDGEMQELMAACEQVATGEKTIDELAAERGWKIIDDWREGRCVVPEPPQWAAADEGGDWTFPGARTPQEVAQAYVDTGDWEPSLRTDWVNVTVYRPAINEDGKLCRVDDQVVKVTIEPDEPPCIDDDDHDWHAPHEIVGGCESNPGVWSSGGGVLIIEVCMRCGCARITDTWAQDPWDGTQGLESVEYKPGRYADAVRKAKKDDEGNDEGGNDDDEVREN